VPKADIAPVVRFEMKEAASRDGFLKLATVAAV
jgi:hypothetical protein